MAESEVDSSIGGVAVAGTLLADVMAYPMSSLPARGRLTMVDSIRFHMGGMAANTGSALARLDVPTFAVGRVGDDLMGRLVRDQLREYCDVRFVRTDARSATSATIVLIAPDGERSLLHSPGSNNHVDTSDVPLTALKDLGVDVLHLGYALMLPGMDGPPMAGLLRAARAASLTTSLDVTWDPNARWMRLLQDVLPEVDLFCPNEDETYALTGETDAPSAARRLLQAGVRELVVLKLGHRGCYVQPRNGTGFFTPCARGRVVDTTAAGDTFVAGLLAARQRGYDLPRAARIANAAACISVGHLGGAPQAISWERVCRLAAEG